MLVSRRQLLRVLVVVPLIVLSRPLLSGHRDVVRRRLPDGGALYQSTYGSSYPVELLYLRPAWSLALVPLGKNPIGNRCPTDVGETAGPRGERVILLERRYWRDESAGCAIVTLYPPQYAAFVGQPWLLGIQWLATDQRFPAL